MMPPDDLGALSMEQLFQMEAETQCALLSDGLVALEASPEAQETLTILMRAAHSLKGAARIVGHNEAVRIAHAMEDCFVLGQKGGLRFDAPAIDLMLRGTDLLKRSAISGATTSDEVAEFIKACEALTAGKPAISTPATASTPEPQLPTESVASVESDAQMLRVDARKLDRLLGFAGEGLVAARQLDGFLADFRRLGQVLSETAARLPVGPLEETERARRTQECRDMLTSLGTLALERHVAMDAFARHWNLHADRLYQEALACRMRPLADILPGLRRLVRDLSRELGKPATLEIVGGDTPVDREILERLEAPLTHLLRNALDHGIESPAERAAAGKPEAGRITIDARHSGGHLVISVSDDGGGLDLDKLRERISAREFAPAATVASMTEGEIMDFLFLPGFSMRDTVTEISGRGVGLDVVQSMARSVRGSVRATLHPTHGIAFELRLPISLSVLRSLLVSISGEPFAFPLAHLERALKVPVESIESAEGRQFFQWEGTRIPLASASQILGLDESAAEPEAVCVLLLTHQGSMHGVIVEDFLGEHDLVIQPLDPALGKVPGISSASLTTDGAPVLVADTGDFVVALERLASTGQTRAVQAGARAGTGRRKRLLVVEDSLTVRELERKLLLDRGYDVEVAVDGMDGWTALRDGGFDLVLTDVDMPRLDGIELTRLIKADARLRDTPVMIISYKDREEDRRRGLEAGADYYLTKGSFQDRTLLKAVIDLVGEPATP
jgi:two-component system sensor histidine kinase and response regulator WspE